jgi:hypothetical protein
MDYIGVRRYGADGKPSGEVRFVGLFTAEAYEEPARDGAAGPPQGRACADGPARSRQPQRKAPAQHPRDLAARRAVPDQRGRPAGHGDGGAAPLRPAARALFARRDPFDRFMSILLFVPRDRYGSGVRQRAGEILAEGLRRPGLGLLSDLLRTAAGAGPLHHRRHPRRTPSRTSSPSRPRSPRPPAPGRTGSRPPCALTGVDGQRCAAHPRRAGARPSRPATATSTTPPRP